MEWWGRNIDARWEQAVLGNFSVYLDVEYYDESPTKKELFFYCISLLIERKARMTFGGNAHAAVVHVMQDFQTYYDGLYEKTHDFFLLSVRSIQHVNLYMAAVHAQQAAYDQYNAIEEGAADTIES